MSHPSPDRMHRVDPKLLELVFDYVNRRLNIPQTPLDFPGSKPVLDQLLDGLITPEGRDPAAIMELYEDHLAKSVLSADSPRFLAFIPAAPTKAALLFDMVVSAASLQGVSWLEAAGAVAAENQALRWIADAAGLPVQAGGTFVSGGSAGNLNALAVAREQGRHRMGRDRRLRIAVSDQAHSSITNTLHLLDVDAFVVPTSDHRFTGEALVAALAADPTPETVVGVASTAGTTNAGIVDDLRGLGQVAGEREMWLHVDAAYGGGGLLAPSVRHHYDGIELADSIVVDPHKWLFAPYDCAALLYRKPGLARAVHTQDASYLDVIHERPEEWNPSDYAYHLTRRARGLPLWFSLVVNGTDAYRDAIEASIALARRTADRIERTAHLRLIRQPTLSVVLFERIGWKPHDYSRWADGLLADQVAFVTPTSWEGQTVGRFAFLHPATDDAMLDPVFAATQ